MCSISFLVHRKTKEKPWQSPAASVTGDDIQWHQTFVAHREESTREKIIWVFSLQRNSCLAARSTAAYGSERSQSVSLSLKAFHVRTSFSFFTAAVGRDLVWSVFTSISNLTSISSKSSGCFRQKFAFSGTIFKLHVHLKPPQDDFFADLLFAFPPKYWVF